MIVRPLLITLSMLLLTHTPTLSGADQPLQVKVLKDGTGKYKTIQEAIDQSPAGTTIKIGPGEWNESLKIKHSVTLEGSGWETTRIISKPSNKNKKLDEILTPLLNELDRVTRKKVIEAYLKIQSSPTVVSISETNKVVLQNISFINSLPVRKQAANTMIIDIKDSEVQMDNCAILQSPQNGIIIQGKSDVKINQCLVAGCRHTGLAVIIDKNGSFEINNSEIRNNKYSCISIRSLSKNIHVNHCLIHDTGWHGIRYDNSVPTIKENVFYSTAVSGIYASGKTNATVSNNLFYHSGVSCWFQNQDKIESNTFIGDFKSKKKSGITQGLSVLGASEPVIKNNIFVSCENAINHGDINSKSRFSKASKNIQLKNNRFWNNKRNLASYDLNSKQTESRPLPEGNIEKALEFIDEENRNYQLQKDSPLLKTKTGARDFASFESHWPLQDEEKEAIKLVNERLNQTASRQK